ncbi:MAG: hypothetical protein KGV59_06095 [Tenacibaculum sp.]|nr:hypothetical protein [Tenacibaculum sp.]
MFLEVVTPEAILFSSEVDSVAVPGIKGEFHMMNNHAPVVSLLGKGMIKIYTHSQKVNFDELHSKVTPYEKDNKILVIKINDGTIELKDNKIIILAD